MTYAVVSGHSMEPSLYTGDLVMVQKESSYKVGDTVLTEVMGGMVIHRIVWISSANVKTQGVNNDFVDTWTLPLSAIKGKQVFVFKQLGTYFVLLRTNPLIFGLLASGLGALLLVDPRRKKYSKRLIEILESADHEVAKKTKTYLNKVLVGLYVLAGGSLVSTGILLANHTKFFPRVLLSLSGVAVSIVAFELVGNWLASAKDLDEPDRSMAIFGSHLYRIKSEVQIPGPTQPVATASELLTYSEIGKTPILHLVSEDNLIHRFIVVTDSLNYAYTVDLSKETNSKGRHKK